MEPTYDDIRQFMMDYFVTFNKYGQNPDTIHRMDDYFAPEVEFMPYVAQVIKTRGREEFYKVLLSHPSGFEKLTPEDIVVDEKRKIAVVLIRAEISDSHSGELLVSKHYFVRYPLVLDEHNSLKIEKLQLFWEVLPTGMMEIDDVFSRDRK
jgi:hypothetical protein